MDYEGCIEGFALPLALFLHLTMQNQPTLKGRRALAA
jgi:hypothetical protein